MFKIEKRYMFRKRFNILLDTSLRDGLISDLKYNAYLHEIKTNELNTEYMYGLYTSFLISLMN